MDRSHGRATVERTAYSHLCLSISVCHMSRQQLGDGLQQPLTSQPRIPQQLTIIDHFNSCSKSTQSTLTAQSSLLPSARASSSLEHIMSASRVATNWEAKETWERLVSAIIATGVKVCLPVCHLCLHSLADPSYCSSTSVKLPSTTARRTTRWRTASARSKRTPLC